MSTEDKRNDFPGHVLVDTSEAIGLNLVAGLFQYFTLNPIYDGLIEFEDSSRQLPMKIIPALHDQNITILVDNDSRDANRVLGSHGCAFLIPGAIGCFASVPPHRCTAQS